MRQVAADIVLPRFRQLAREDIEEKSPGDPVTIADRESELRLAEGLANMLPDVRILGEEATAADPELMQGIGQGALWIIDPIDGTANFAAGKAPFAIMVALAHDGVAEAGWILDPLSGRLCHALRGNGAFIDGDRIAARGSGAERPIATLATSFMPREEGQALMKRAAGRLTPAEIPKCAGEQYPRIALGQNDISIFHRALPWDHVPGALFLEEAGGKVAHPDGKPYRFAEGRQSILGASTPALWDRAAEILFR
jgi:fructose-1,6-bisphosphatase/inositol monophosphatase family enzyme